VLEAPRCSLYHQPIYSNYLSIYLVAMLLSIRFLLSTLIYNSLSINQSSINGINYHCPIPCGFQANKQ